MSTAGEIVFERDEFFEWRDSHTGESIVFDIKRLTALAQAGAGVPGSGVERVVIEIGDDMRAACAESWAMCDVAYAREHATDERPLLIVRRARDGASMLVDGNHRALGKALAAPRNEPPTARAYLIDERVARIARVERETFSVMQSEYRLARKALDDAAQFVALTERKLVRGRA